MKKIKNIELIRKAIKAGNSIVVSLPKKNAEELGIKEGDYIKINFQKVNFK